MTEQEVQQLQAWNQTETDYPKNQTIVDLFQAQVEKTPNNIAVVFEGQVLSYQVLNTKANQLAHYLMTLGVGAETLVGICVERSLARRLELVGFRSHANSNIQYMSKMLDFLSSVQPTGLFLTCNDNYRRHFQINKFTHQD